MAEREGFEPSMEFNPHTPLAGERLQPLGHLSGKGGKYIRVGDKIQICPDSRFVSIISIVVYLADSSPIAIPDVISIKLASAPKFGTVPALGK